MKFIQHGSSSSGPADAATAAAAAVAEAESPRVFIACCSLRT